MTIAGSAPSRHVEPHDAAPLVDCGVVVVTYNSAAHIEAFLASLPAASAGRSIRVVVVDNGSSDATTKMVEAHHDVELLNAGANVGYAAGINLGRRAVGPCRSILILNPDLVLSPGCIERLYDVLGVDGHVGAVVGRLVDAEGGHTRSLRRFPTLRRAVGDAAFGDLVQRRPAWSAHMVNDVEAYESPHDVDWAVGAAMLISADCDTAVGDWDESFFLYSEEVDYSLRIQQAGYRVVFTPEAVCMHHEGGSGRNDDLEALLSLNRVRLFKKHHGRLHTAMFRLLVVLHESVRCWSRSHRHAAMVVAGLRPVPSFPAAPPLDPVPW